MKVWDSREAIT